MSYTKASYKKYNRQENRETTAYELDQCHLREYWQYEDDYAWYEEDDSWCNYYGYYHRSGYCLNMNEYHIMHLLTLLIHFNVPYAKEYSSDKGWYPYFFRTYNIAWAYISAQIMR